MYAKSLAKTSLKNAYVKGLFQVQIDFSSSLGLFGKSPLSMKGEVLMSLKNSVHTYDLLKLVIIMIMPSNLVFWSCLVNKLEPRHNVYIMQQ